MTGSPRRADPGAAAMGKNMRIKTAPKANRVPLLGDGVGRRRTATSSSLSASQPQGSYSNLVSDDRAGALQETSRALSDLEEGSDVQVRRRPAPARPPIPSFPHLPHRDNRRPDN